MKTYALIKNIHEDGRDDRILVRTIITTADSAQAIKDLLKQLEKQFSLAFLDGKFDAMTRLTDGFDLRYKGLRYYHVQFYLTDLESNDMKMLDLIESEMGQVI